MDRVGTHGAAETWTNQYPWAYVDAAKAQLSRLVRGMNAGAIRPTRSDTQHLEVALDDLVRQATLLRQLLAEVTVNREQHR